MTRPDPHAIDSKTSDPIRHALRSLPREAASPGFTARLLERASAPLQVAPRRAPWRRLAAAAAVVLSLAAALLYQRLQVRRELDRRAALELRHDELRRELAALRLQASDAPTLYLGTMPGYDVVVDLSPWLERDSVQPASYAPASH